MFMSHCSNNKEDGTTKQTSDWSYEYCCSFNCHHVALLCCPTVTARMTAVVEVDEVVATSYVCVSGVIHRWLCHWISATVAILGRCRTTAKSHTYHLLILFVVAVYCSLVVDHQNQTVLPNSTLVSTLAHWFVDTLPVLGDTVLQWYCHKEETSIGIGKVLQHRCILELS